MKKIVIVSILVLVMVCSLSTVVKAADQIDIGEFETIETTSGTEPVEQTQTQTTTTTTTGTDTTTTTETTDNTKANTKNPQTGIKEEAPIIIVTIIGVCVAAYAGRKIKKYNY